MRAEESFEEFSCRQARQTHLSVLTLLTPENDRLQQTCACTTTLRGNVRRDSQVVNTEHFIS
jgi:hypothetical protein